LGGIGVEVYAKRGEEIIRLTKRLDDSLLAQYIDICKNSDEKIWADCYEKKIMSDTILPEIAGRYAQVLIKEFALK
jgi:hypothetical protein